MSVIKWFCEVTHTYGELVEFVMVERLPVDDCENAHMSSGNRNKSLTRTYLYDQQQPAHPSSSAELSGEGDVA